MHLSCFTLGIQLAFLRGGLDSVVSPKRICVSIVHGLPLGGGVDGLGYRQGPQKEQHEDRLNRDEAKDKLGQRCSVALRHKLQDDRTNALYENSIDGGLKEGFTTESAIVKYLRIT